MRNSLFRIITLALLLTTNPGGQARAEVGCCAHCGSHNECHKVCRLVREDKKVPFTCWGIVCEDVCMPGCSKKGCRHEECVCEECADPCDEKKPSSVARRFVWYDWIPGCSHGIRNHSKLMKKVITKKVPSYKWVVEDVCGPCEKCVAPTLIEPGAQIPAPPVASATLIPGQSTSAPSELTTLQDPAPPSLNTSTSRIH